MINLVDVYCVYVRRYMLQLLLSLRDVHKLYVMHRDLKPNNLLIDYKGKD